MPRSPIQVSRVRISTVQDPEIRERLLQLYGGYEVARRAMVAAQRASMQAQADLSRASADSVGLYATFLSEVGNHFDEVAKEASWNSYRDKEDVVLESFFTERDVRNAMRVQRHQLQREIDSTDTPDMFEHGDEVETVPTRIGFGRG